MAVYTKLNKSEIEEIISLYKLKDLESFAPIEEGIENTNYVIIASKKKYILTIFEKRVKEQDLPFFCELISLLNKSGFKCPLPLLNLENSPISTFKRKKLTILTFISGKSKENLSNENCEDIGKEAAKLHLLTSNFKIHRKNALSIESWRNMFENIKDKCIKIHKDLPNLIEANLKDIEKNWPSNLPSGIIHADLFKDNIIFENNKVSGIIDFTFSCNDFYALEIAICFNALCFDGVKSNLSFNVTKAKKFIDGYSSIRKLSNQERNSIKILSQGAALRFLLTRVFDAINTVEGALVKIKDPIEYLKRLEFHKNAKSYEDYFF
jgi:homoserine kinase type II